MNRFNPFSTRTNPQRMPLLATMEARDANGLSADPKLIGVKRGSSGYDAAKQQACRLACNALSAKANTLLSLTQRLPAAKRDMANSARTTILAHRNAILCAKEVYADQLSEALSVYQNLSEELYSTKIKFAKAPLTKAA